MNTMADEIVDVIGGVDTHGDVHVARRDRQHRPASSAPRRSPPPRPGIGGCWRGCESTASSSGSGWKGTGSWGAGLARYLTGEGVEVVEVDRPNRQVRRLRGKSDPVDAEAAARAALNGEAKGTPKTRTGPVEAIRALRVARRSAMKARTQALAQIRSL